MKVIYHDKSGRHLSVVASALHLQICEDVSRRELEKLPYFMHSNPPGTLLYMGLDSQGNEVYALGRGRAFGIVRNAYLGLNRAFQLNQDIMFVDVQQLAGWSIKIFDLMNRKPEEGMKWTNLMYQGVEQVKPKLKGLVSEVRKKLNQGGI